MVINTDYEVLGNMLRQLSVRQGNFLLASGKRANVYVDTRLTMFNPVCAKVAGRLLLEKIHSVGWSPDAVGGMVRGATPVSFAISCESLEQKTPISLFMVQKPLVPGEPEIQGIADTAGMKVVITDDTVSTGGSICDAIEACIRARCSILGAVCLVDRQMGAAELLHSRYGCDLHSLFQLSDLVVKQ